MPASDRLPPRSEGTPRVVNHGKINVGPFEADIREEGGFWLFRPYYNDRPRDTAAIEMNAMIRSMGRIWTPIPESEIPMVKKVLADKRGKSNADPH